MKNYSIYFLKFVTMIVISVLLYIYVFGIDKYFEHLLPHGMTIVGIYLIAWWTVNLMDTTLFFVVGKMKGFTCGMLNFYPIYKSRCKVFCSWNVINVVRLTNTYSLPYIGNEELPGISTAKKEAIRMQMISMFCISIVSLIVGIVISNTFLCIVFFVSMLRYITTRFYNESDYFHRLNQLR